MKPKLVMNQIEKHLKIAIGLRKGIKKRNPAQEKDGKEIMTQLDIFEQDL